MLQSELFSKSLDLWLCFCLASREPRARRFSMEQHACQSHEKVFLMPAKTWPMSKILKCMAMLVLAVAAAFSGWLYWMFHGGVFSTSSFDSSAWHATPTNETGSSCFRGGMANDIKSNVLQTGFLQTTVKDLLGEADRETPLEFQYNLGMCSGLQIDFDTLNVYFNEKGELVGIAIVQH